MMLFTAALITATLPLLAQAKIDKPAAWTGLGFARDQLNKLPRTGAVIQIWKSGYINEACYEHTKDKNPKDFTAYTVWMNDCNAQPWVICRQNGHARSIEDTVAAFARLPIGIRQWVGDITLFKDGVGGSMRGRHITLSGASVADTAIMIHEGMHVVDRYGALGEFMHAQGEYSKDWRAAHDKDPKVADNYAQNNHIEVCSITALAFHIHHKDPD